MLIWQFLACILGLTLHKILTGSLLREGAWTESPNTVTLCLCSQWMFIVCMAGSSLRNGFLFRPDVNYENSVRESNMTHTYAYIAWRELSTNESVIGLNSGQCFEWVQICCMAISGGGIGGSLKLYSPTKSAARTQSEELWCVHKVLTSQVSKDHLAL